jgi:hypothetical protein
MLYSAIPVMLSLAALTNFKIVRTGTGKSAPLGRGWQVRGPPGVLAAHDSCAHSAQVVSSSAQILNINMIGAGQLGQCSPLALAINPFL